MGPSPYYRPYKKLHSKKKGVVEFETSIEKLSVPKLRVSTKTYQQNPFAKRRSDVKKPKIVNVIWHGISPDQLSSDPNSPFGDERATLMGLFAHVQARELIVDHAMTCGFDDLFPNATPADLNIVVVVPNHGSTLPGGRVFSPTHGSGRLRSWDGRNIVVFLQKPTHRSGLVRHLRMWAESALENPNRCPWGRERHHA